MGRKVDDRETLLPTNHATPTPPSDTLFKTYVIISMTILWTGYTLTVRYTRSTTSVEELYSGPTVVFMGELVKLLISLFMIFKTHDFGFSETKRTIWRHFLGEPKELLKMSVPSIAYALQNNLDFVALQYLDAATYQVTTQLKVVTTALFMMAFLGRRFSRTRWLAIGMLFVGVATVQLNAVEGSAQDKTGVALDGYTLGICAVLATCVTAGFAGVYFEKMLKDNSGTPFWIRNMQMYSCGVISAGLGILTDSDQVFERGFFHGYTNKVFAIVGFLSVGGVYISLVMKHLDNLHKSFASAVSIILVAVLSWMFLVGAHLGVYFILGSSVVCFAVLLYNSVPE